MRVLTLSNCPLKEHQGSGYVIVNFARGLRSKGHDVDLFGPEHFEPLRRIKRAKSYRQAAGILIFALRQLATKEYDVVEFYGAEACLAASFLARRSGRSFLMVAHSNGIETFVHDRLMSALGSFSLNGAPTKWYQSMLLLPIEKAFTKVDAIVTVSQAERDYALKHHYQNEDRIAAIENPLPDEFLRQTVSFERERVIGYCGGWLARKGAALITADIPRILAEFPEYRFKLIGVGERFRKEEHFPSGVLGQIDVVPFVDDKEQLRALYHSLAILIVPSVHESFGLVTAEGMACGCALVAGKTGFAQGLKDGEEAVLLADDVSMPLYQAIKGLIADDSIRRKIAQAGYGRVQNLCWPEAINRLESLYGAWLNALHDERKCARV